MELSFKKEKKFKTEKPTFDNGVKWVILGLIALQGFLTAATYNSASMLTIFAWIKFGSFWSNISYFPTRKKKKFA